MKNIFPKIRRGMAYIAENLHGRPPKYLVNKSHKRGIDVLRDPSLNKGAAFNVEERQVLGIHGLLPPTVLTIEDQKRRILESFNKKTCDLDKYTHMMGLHDRNEKLFYKIITENIEQMMPIIYTPTVGLACQSYGLVFRRPRGLFISIKDKGHIYEVLCNWPQKNIKAICVTDGERILGLGDLGAYGMGIPVGKLSLYTALGGIRPSRCLPILLDVGTNNLDLHEDPLYIGSCSPRVTGKEYEDFVDEFMEAVVRRFGSECLVQFEDFANHNAFKFLSKYRHKYCTFNDDIQGTASVVTAGVMASLRVNGSEKLLNNKILFFGAGEAALGIAQLLYQAMLREGASEEEARSKIWMIDIGGLLVKGREAPIIGDGKYFAKDFKHMTNLEEIVEELKPTHLIGASACPGAFTTKVLKTMAANNERPAIFALSNPTSKAECTAEAAYHHTEGRCVFASGSPFAPVEYNGTMMYPGQGNNAYIFPGVALAIITCGVHHISDDVFLRAARMTASMVTEEHLAEGRLYPPLKLVHHVSFNIAVDLAEYFYEEKLASHYPEPVDKSEFITSFLYDTDYENFLPPTWEWKD